MERILKNFIFAILVTVLSATYSWSSVVYNNSASAQAFGTSIDYSINIIGSSGSVGCQVFLGFNGTATTGHHVTVNGVSATLVPNSTANYGTVGTTVLADFSVALGNVTGLQAVHGDWATSEGMSSVTICSTGVDQITPTQNGNNGHSTFSSGTTTLNVTSVSGNLPVEMTYDGTGHSLSLPNQTQRLLVNYSNVCSGSNTCVGASTGDGSGSATFHWNTTNGDDWVESGADFVAAATTAPPKALGALGVGL